MFYNLGLAGRDATGGRHRGFATTIAPGLRDVLLTGKIKEAAVRLDANKRQAYDAVVVDSPPTGRITRFLDVTKALSDIARAAVHSQAEGRGWLLHSEQTAIPSGDTAGGAADQETIKAIEESGPRTPGGQ